MRIRNTGWSLNFPFTVRKIWVPVPMTLHLQYSVTFIPNGTGNL